MQANIFMSLTIAGVSPNLFIILILFIGLFTNSKYGVISGAFFGIVIDCIYGKCIGITAVMLCIIGFLGALFDKNFSKENKITIIFMVAGCTILYELGWYILNMIILNFSAEWFLLIKIILIETLYNIILSILLYPLIQKAGFSIDRIFKKNNVLTRYF